MSMSMSITLLLLLLFPLQLHNKRLESFLQVKKLSFFGPRWPLKLEQDKILTLYSLQSSSWHRFKRSSLQICMLKNDELHRVCCCCLQMEPYQCHTSDMHRHTHTQAIVCHMDPRENLRYLHKMTVTRTCKGRVVTRLVCNATWQYNFNATIMQHLPLHCSTLASLDNFMDWCCMFFDIDYYCY